MRNNSKILLVDDFDATCWLNIIALNRMGFINIKAANNEISALSMLKEEYKN